MNIFMYLFFIAAGCFSIAGAWFNWNWFFNYDEKTKMIVSLFGRTGARIFYAMLGSGLVAFGIVVALGIIK